MKKNYILGAGIVVALVGIILAYSPSFAKPDIVLSSIASNATVPSTSQDSESITVVAAEQDSAAVDEVVSDKDIHPTQESTAVDDVAPEQAQQPTEDKSIADTAAKVLDAISKHPAERPVKIPDWKNEQNRAVEAARSGDYDTALPILEALRADHPEDVSIASDYAAILGWAGRDTDAVAAYRSMPEGERPDYLIDSIGHAYRNLHQPEEALAVYHLGLQTYPTNQSLLAGEILSLLEADHGKEALARAQDAADKYATPVESLSLAIRTAIRANAVSLARTGQYKEALSAFAALHEKYPSDLGITGDYVSVLSWAGHDSEATALYHTLPQDGNLPDYVLDAAAHSYRSMHQPQQALDLYQAALDKAPDNITYAVGVIYSFCDLARSKEAVAFADAQLAKHPEKPEALVNAHSYAERHFAIDLARAGHFDQSLALLRDLRVKYPSDVGVKMDYVAVLSWSGKNAEAIKEYEKLAGQKFPDYVLEAVGGSYRALHQSEKSLVVYRHGLSQSPANDVFAAGIIRCLDDLGRYAEGQGQAEDFTRKHGDHLDVLLAGGEAANFNDQPIIALNFYEHAQSLAPKNSEALRGVIHAEDRLGAPQLALKQADKHPGILDGEAYRAIVGDADQALVRWGPLEPTSEATRYDATDRALYALDAHIAAWTAQDDPALNSSIQRARFDRLVALRDRQRMQEVVDDYNSLVRDGLEVPSYALEPVGEAYLYLRQPEIARDVFLKVLQTDPNDFEARRLLAYAYLECDQYDESFATVDKLREDEPLWIYLKGEPERQPNPNRAIAELDSGEMLAYGEMLQEADDSLTALVEAGPFDARHRAAAGNVYLSRGWPRAALEQYQIGLAIQDGHDVSTETGIATADLALQNFDEAEAKTQNLITRFPENLSVQRASRDWDIHNMAELDIHAGYNFAPSGGAPATEISHGQGNDIGAELYSAPLDYNWRLFAGEDYAHEHEPNSEGIIDYTRANAGVEYRNGDVTATAAPTFNTYNNNNRVGADGTFKYSFTDLWSAGIAAELFSQETPLRALNANVTADRYDVNGMWRQSESRQLSLDAYVMPFSDHNLRTVQDAEYIERLYTNPQFKLDAEVDATSTQDNKNQSRLYYNPSLDFTGMAGLRATQTLYHRYETLYEHSLLAMPGMYSQQHYGTSPAWTVRYEQRVHYNDTLSAGAGVNYTHQDYDGAAEDAVSLTIDIVERF